ncbi:hypothetical protein [Snuella sedimenti]|uniref:Uncharacterized protein n=1 Tax=Snuella sedimenti TaxID=2798802 RepID=A0A8J7J1H0_9FLAO|nr:hypothetical protein [Snuella sedimenti]MBJ6367229.1 hypothetical protein [Snuella sedimenti]
MSSIEKMTDEATKSVFDKKVLTAAQQLHPYVKHRLYIAASTGVIPKNMYTSNGIVDESIAQLYESGYNIDNSALDIKLKLFKIANNVLDNLFEKEAFHKDTMSTNTLLEAERNHLKEEFTFDEGFDFIMNDNLNDKSYSKKKNRNPLFLYDDKTNSVLNAFEMETDSSNTKTVLGDFYSWLPLNVSNIIDLYAFGKLSFEEISKVKSIEERRIQRIFDELKKNLIHRLV